MGQGKQDINALIEQLNSGEIEINDDTLNALLDATRRLLKERVNVAYGSELVSGGTRVPVRERAQSLHDEIMLLREKINQGGQL